MAYFLDFIKQSTSATYLVTTKEFNSSKSGSDEAALRAATAEYHSLMEDALKNANVNYAYCQVKSDAGVIMINDVQGEYVDRVDE